MISATRTHKKKAFRVTFAPGTKTEEEQISNFVRAVEHQGPGIDDLSKMIKSLPTKKSAHVCPSEESQSISNMIFQLRKTLDNMLEKDCTVCTTNNDNSMRINTNIKAIENSTERRSSNSSISSVDSAIADCDHTHDFFQKNDSVTSLNDDLSNDNNTMVSSPKTRQRVSDLLKELDTCIEELREDDLSTDDESGYLSSPTTPTSTPHLFTNHSQTCVKDVFAAGILIASFIQTTVNDMSVNHQYSVLTDNKIYMFESNRSKSPLMNTFDFNAFSLIEKSKMYRNALDITGDYEDKFNTTLSNKITLIFSSEEECNIWYKLLLDVLRLNFPSIKKFPTRTVSLNKHHPSQTTINALNDYYNPRQTIISALCVLENIEKQTKCEE